MKNKEKYVDDIIAIASNGYNIAVRRVYEQVVGCEATDCRDCVFLEGNCAENRQKWFESEADPAIDELKAELETVKKERDELRARLEKAVELPCKVGDTVYHIQYFCNYKKCDSTTQQICCGCKEMIERERRNEKYVICEKPFELKDLTEIGKKYFTTRAEAEARLKELNGGER